MFCFKCGKEINDGSLFCKYCGAKMTTPAEVVQQQNEKPEVGEKKENKNLFIISVIALLLIILILIAAGIFILIKGNESKSVISDNEKVVEETENANDNVEEQAQDNTTENNEDMGENESGQKETEQAVKEAEAYDGHILLVCAPVDYMSLRTSPGLGDDVIAELSAGTYLKWYGEKITVNETEFYKVKVRDSGQEGYVSSRFCVMVEYEYDEHALNTVETYTTIYTYDMMAEDIEALCKTYSDRLAYNIIGTSLDGRNIYEVILGNPNAENHIMMQAAIHGREYMTVQLVMKLLEYYSYYYETAEFGNITYKELFDKTAIHIVPMTNPDGVTISQFGVDALNNSYYAELAYECYERDKYYLVEEEDTNGDLNWSDYYRDDSFIRSDDEKEITFKEYQNIWKANAAGVDLNNNFDAGWEELDLKYAPSYSNYKGDYAVSEPESEALVKLAKKYDYSFFVSYHSRGQLIYYDVTGNTTQNSTASTNYATLLDNWIKYKKVSTDKGYNVNLGGFGDWVQLSLNKPSVTIESGKKPCPLPIGEFPAMWYRHRESWAMLAQQFYY